jgi:hypothetical protein
MPWFHTTNQRGDQTPTEKVQAIHVLNLCNNVKGLRHFLVKVQYYRNMWAKRSGFLAPLTDLVEVCGKMKTTKKNINKHFDNIKAAIAKEVVLAYLDFLKHFEMYTDASTTQLGAVITQDKRLTAFFGRKLSKMQL